MSWEDLTVPSMSRRQVVEVTEMEELLNVCVTDQIICKASGCGVWQSGQDKILWLPRMIGHIIVK